MIKMENHGGMFGQGEPRIKNRVSIEKSIFTWFYFLANNAILMQLTNLFQIYFSFF